MDGRLCAVNAARIVLGRGEPFGLVSRAIEKLDSQELMEVCSVIFLILRSSLELMEGCMVTL